MHFARSGLWSCVVDEALRRHKAAGRPASRIRKVLRILHPRKYRNHLPDGSGTRVLRQRASAHKRLITRLHGRSEMQRVARVQQAGFIDLGVLKGNIATRTTTLVATWTWRNTAQCPSGANVQVNFGAGR